MIIVGLDDKSKTNFFIYWKEFSFHDLNFLIDTVQSTSVGQSVYVIYCPFHSVVCEADDSRASDLLCYIIFPETFSLINLIFKREYNDIMGFE